jgi:lysophospholipid acyltransferase (LPLAT)-like uncharacterized protein
MTDRFWIEDWSLAIERGRHSPRGYYNWRVPTTEAASIEENGAGRFTLRQRLALWFITWAAWMLIRLIGPTLRQEVSVEEGAPAELATGPVIYPFWHRCVIPACWAWRGRQIRVMTSQSFDGEYIARIISRFGFVPVRGSSTRGGPQALLGMKRALEQGQTAAFTIDGPRGPRYVAKPGPVLLAQTTGAPICAFYVAVEKAWVLNTWDALIIPQPFSRTLTRVSRVIQVPVSGGEDASEACYREMQAALERVRDYAEAEFRRGEVSGRRR